MDDDQKNVDIDNIEIKYGYSDEFRRIIVSGMIGGISPIGLEMSIYTERRDVSSCLSSPHVDANKVGIVRQVECELILDPLQMKIMHQWLGNQIESFEKNIGKILVEERKDTKALDEDIKSHVKTTD